MLGVIFGISTTKPNAMNAFQKIRALELLVAKKAKEAGVKEGESGKKLAKIREEAAKELGLV